MFSALASVAAPALANIYSAKSQNIAAGQRADRAMAFSEEMSSTAYQRAMIDMHKAGLNPILAYQKGGASSPAGVAA